MIRVSTWATPLTIGSFFLMAGTGVLMFFGLQRGLVGGLHEWCSWIFLFGTGGHIAANVRPFNSHLKSRRGRASVAACAVVLATAFSSWGVRTGDQLRADVTHDLTDAPLSTLAGLRGTTPDALVTRLKAHGVSATPRHTIRELAGGDQRRELHLLALVFVPE